LNRAHWDALAAVHGHDAIYDTEALVAGANSLREAEAAAVHQAVGSVAGLDVIHGSFYTWAITGEFNMANRPGKGVVLHDSGRIEFDQDGEPIIFRGVHDTFTKGEQAFCDALS
jgi:hypothetical protein